MNLVINRIKALRGPNIWSLLTVFEIEIFCRDQTLSSALLDHLANFSFLSNLFLEIKSLLPNGSILELFAQLIIFFQQYAECNVNFYEVHSLSAEHTFKIVVEYSEEEVAREAIQIVNDFLASLLSSGNYPLLEKLIKLRELAREVRLGPSTQAIVSAVKKREIPVIRLNNYNLVQCGYGAQQVKIQAAETDRTSIVGENIAQNKELTKNLLNTIGIPTPQGASVASFEEAWDFACRVKTPIVIKPQLGHQGKGVAINLLSREQIQAGFEAAEKLGPVMVETMMPGEDYRLLVVNKKLVAAAKREPPSVIGDGKKTISELVADTNQDPRRSEGHATELSKLILDDIAIGVLEQHGLNVNSVLAPNQKAIIRANANLSTGGCATDVTKLVHPKITAQAIAASEIIGLDIMGIDVIAQDISQPLEEQNGGFIEVNAAPGLRMHLAPAYGEPQPVAEAIAEGLFPMDQDGRIPLVAVTGTNGKTTIVRLIAAVLRKAGFYTGFTCTDGVYANDDCLDVGDCSGPKSAKLLLKNPCIEAAVLETARGGILREGLAFDHCQVAVVSNIGLGDHLELDHINTLDDLVRVKQTIVTTVLPKGAAVLNALDPLVAGMRSVCPGEVIYFSSMDEFPLISEHLASGGRAVYQKEDKIIFAQGKHIIFQLSLLEMPLTHGGKIKFQIENILAASAAIWALNINLQILSQTLLEFKGNVQDAPGRFNIFSVKGACVILDYGHNISALESIINSLNEFSCVRRSVVYSAVGDRRDQDIIAQANLLAQAFDQIYIYEEESCRRGRPAGEILSLLQEGIGKENNASQSFVFDSELNATQSALKDLKTGDLLLIQLDNVPVIMEFVKQFVSEAA